MTQVPYLTVEQQRKQGDVPADEWDIYWRHFGRLLDPPPPPQDWRVVPGCERVARLLRDQGVRSVLEAASGIGLKAITLHRLGFEVVGMDASLTGTQKATQLGHAIGILVPFHNLTWSEAPTRFVGEFDAVFNDEITHLRSRGALSEAARCAYAALRPGGILVFGGREEEEWGMSAAALVERHWGQEPPHTIAWSRDTAWERHVTLCVRERFPAGIYHHFYHINDPILGEGEGARTVEASGFFLSYQWTWEDCKRVLYEVGFSAVTRVMDSAGSGSYASGVATK